MCGRFSLFAGDDELVSAFDLDLLEGENTGPRYNLAPSQDARVVLERIVEQPDADGVLRSRVVRKGRYLQWGLVPSWAKDAKRPMINARAETVTEKPMFRAAALRRRCLVPANGYYEWQTSKTGRKTPWFLSAGEGDPLMSFAGVYEAWRDPAVPEVDPAGAWLLTFAILTRSAPDALGVIHDRTPVVVPPDLRGDWLDPALIDKAEVRALVDAIPAPDLRPRIVSPRVGNVRTDDPTLIEEIPS